MGKTKHTNINMIITSIRRGIGETLLIVLHSKQESYPDSISSIYVYVDYLCYCIMLMEHIALTILVTFQENVFICLIKASQPLHISKKTLIMSVAANTKLD